MGLCFQVKDPRGLTVICTEERWNDHVLLKRPWMDGWEDRVIAAISDPYPRLIFQDSTFPDRNIYYRKQTREGHYLKVVVAFSQSGPGELITAHPADSMKVGENWIWPASRD